MKPVKYEPDVIRNFLLKEKIATMDKLKSILHTKTTMTVFRKLKGLKYISSYSHRGKYSSYSHRGKYYTLKSIPRFNRHNLWTHKNIHFSRYDTLLETARVLVDTSEKGYSASELFDILHVHSELFDILHVQPKESLLALCDRKLIQRDKMDGHFVYFSNNNLIGKKQTLLRQDYIEGRNKSRINFHPDVLAHELKAAVILFYSLLDEQQRRLYAGLESLKLGRGGDSHIAKLLHINPHTVSKGREELLGSDVNFESVRKQGGGRILTEKKFQES
jgi:hypothetical protein